MCTLFIFGCACPSIEVVQSILCKFWFVEFFCSHTFVHWRLESMFISIIMNTIFWIFANFVILIGESSHENSNFHEITLLNFSLDNIFKLWERFDFHQSSQFCHCISIITIIAISNYLCSKFWYFKISILLFEWFWIWM